MNIVDQMIVLSVFNQVEEELSLAVQIENTLPMALCHLIVIHCENRQEQDICISYLWSQRPSADINSQFIKDRYRSDSEFWWPRYDYDSDWNRISSEDYVLECNKQRLEFIRHLIGKVEQMSISRKLV